MQMILYSLFGIVTKSPSKCKIADIGLLKDATEDVWGLQLVDLNVDPMKILVVPFPYNKQAQIQKKPLFVTFRNAPVSVDRYSK